MKFDVVSAVYNVGLYLEDYFKSITEQSLNFKDNIRIICIDDGSTDNSAEIIHKWQALYPNNIVYKKQKNAGQAAARNVGIELSTAEYITFIDPDDFVSKDYFKHVDDEISRHKDNDAAMISCNMIFYHEENQTFKATHPLKYRFLKVRTVFPINNIENYMQLSMASAFFKTETIKKLNLMIDTRVKPAAEDSNFVARYMLKASGKAIFLKKSHYYYRKRADQSSTLDMGWQKKERYYNQLKYGYLELLASLKEPIPLWLQRTALYEISWHVKRLVNNKEAVNFLTEKERENYFSIIKSIFSYISSDSIIKFNANLFWFFYKFGTLNSMKGILPKDQYYYIPSFDYEKKQIKIRFFHKTNKPKIEILIDGKKVIYLTSKTISHNFLDLDYCYETYVWVALEENETIQIKIDNHNLRLTLNGRNEYKPILGKVIYTAFKKSVDIKKIPKKARLLRFISQLKIIKKYFKDAWVFIDKDNNADDNAEHFYRYVSKQHKSKNIFFIIKKDAKDWKRLKKQGFRLLKYKGTLHKLAIINAKYLLSSHADRYIVNQVSKRRYGDLLKYKFIFLQHGVISENLSQWLNGIPINHMVSSTVAETKSFFVSEYKYNFTSKEIIASGLPRHDALLKNISLEPKTILIMPTWRKNLMGTPNRYDSGWKISQTFFDSSFFKQWNSLLKNKRLYNLAKEKKLNIKLLLHPNMDVYYDWYSQNFPIEILRFKDLDTVQNLIMDCHLLITDYSSLAFETTFLNRPTIYFQFDYDDIFSGSHTYKLGYFDYVNDGFGSVAYNKKNVIKSLEKILNGNEDPIYSERRQNAFPVRDGKNCERLYNYIIGKETFESLSKSYLKVDNDFFTNDETL